MMSRLAERIRRWARRPVTFERLVGWRGRRLGLPVGDVRRYLDEGGDANRVGQFGWTLLHYAAEDGEVESIRLLVERGARVDAVEAVNGYTPLHVAVDGDCDTSARGGRRPGELATVRVLIELGADECALDKGGETARDIAAAYGESALYDAVSRRGGAGAGGRV